ncbi:PhoX family protein [Catenovulum sp. 2E275]|uniref:PhoX family protein n=1 Tax=Catenovulum sp. 2E275 TaxID=2980497 RepID=UPI0021CF93B2|nr:PhoX family protein [Catenovulum sp. 2E275]MCU4675279.1 PhoX family protein [Catenovulum sp. 2E275]
MKSNLFKMSLLATTVAVALAGCSVDLDLSDDEDDKEQPQQQTVTLEFAELAVPLTDAAQKAVRASTEVTINGELQSINYHTLMETYYKDEITGEQFGISKDYQDEVIKFEDGSPYTCTGADEAVGSGLDHNSILQRNGKIYMVSQFECNIGSLYVQQLQQDQMGKLSPVAGTLEFISQKEEFGGWIHCAGQTTPWQSHLGSEEYEPSGDLTVGTDNSTGDGYFDAVAPYWGGDMNMANPYYYGWTPEVHINDDGEAVYSKHYSMGRFAHELAYVMPDNKTVYLSDDGTNGGFFMFIADEATDLSAGTLYAVKWNQTSAEGAGAADLTWVNLGHASNADIRPYVAAKPHLSEIFEIQQADENNACSEGFTAINTSAGLECVKLLDITKDGKVDAMDEMVASRLETRRFAGYKGATTEFRKEEGISYNAKDGKLYLAMSEVARGMEDNSSNDAGSNNDIRVSKNACGAVYELAVGEDSNIGSSYVAKNISSLVEGIPASYEEGSDYAGNSCDVTSIASPDNVTYLADSNSLIIGEDTSAHINNMIWNYDLDKGTLTRIFTTPVDAETTSPFWHKDINGFGYLTAVTQHPFGDSSKSEVGYVGPFKFNSAK